MGEKTALKLYLISGLSGAGKSSALRVLEDLDYEAIDNLPVSLLPNVVDMALADGKGDIRPALVIGIDARTRNFQPELILNNLNDLKVRDDVNLKILFFDSRNETLARRFTETRRKHPLAQGGQVMNGIIRERQMMDLLRAEADYIFDTSDMDIQELRQTLANKFEREHGAELSITISSFAYPRGVPKDADLVFDVRFLRNPHYVDDLKPLTGRDARVQEYVQQDKRFDLFFSKMSDLILFLLPEYKKEGKSYLNMAIGCTGGRHRSVYTAQKLSEILAGAGYKANLRHRELTLEQNEREG